MDTKLLIKRCQYSFANGTFIVNRLLYPKEARKYATKFLEVVTSLISNSYEILDCVISFTDDEGGSYGDMVLIVDGKFSEDGIKAWEDYYLYGQGRIYWETFHDMIDPTFHIYMNLKHIEGTPLLTVNSIMVYNQRAGKHKGRPVKGKYYLTNVYYTGDGIWIKWSK